MISGHELEFVMSYCRYFGGIKLGTGGLVRAYGGVASECLRNAPTCLVKSKVLHFSFSCCALLLSKNVAESFPTKIDKARGLRWCIWEVGQHFALCQYGWVNVCIVISESCDLCSLAIQLLLLSVAYKENSELDGITFRSVQIKTRFFEQRMKLILYSHSFPEC